MPLFREHIAKIRNVSEIKKYFLTFFEFVLKTVGRLSEKHYLCAIKSIIMGNMSIDETESLAIRVKKLADSQPVISSGIEYEGLYELNNKSAEKYLRDYCRGNYLNIDTGNIIKITRKGAEKVTRHDAENIAHLKSLALIPELIGKSIYIAEEENEKSINEYDTFKYYVVGLKMAEVDYTVKLAIGVKNGYTYYDHALTPISIQKLLKSIDEIKRPFAFKESSANGEQVSDVLSECKDKRLISILQIK